MCRTMLPEELDDIFIASLSGHIKRGFAVNALRVGICSSIEEQSVHRLHTKTSGVVQCRQSATVLRVDVGTFLQQGSGVSETPRLYRLLEASVRACGVYQRGRTIIVCCVDIRTCRQ